MEINKNLNAPVEEKSKVSQYYVISDNGITIEINEDIKPTEIVDYPHLYHANKEVEDSFPYIIPSKRGRWMMFIENNVDFDQKWKDCCKLYDQRKLIGIRYLTCSTGCKTNPAFKKYNVIIFHCGPASDRTKMIEFGLNLLKYIPYCSQNGYIAYKSREQTKKLNTPTDNSDNSYLYRIPVPRDGSSNEKLKSNRFFVRSENLEELNNFIEVDEDIKPSAILDYFYLHHQNMNILNLFPDLRSNSRGQWNMFFKDAEDFDNKWKDCCKLYQEGKLIGIRSIKCTTGGHKKNHFRSENKIIFICGPANDKSKMLEYGKNLLKCIPYCSDSGYMTFKSKEGNSMYRIPVPKSY